MLEEEFSRHTGGKSGSGVGFCLLPLPSIESVTFRGFSQRKDWEGSGCHRKKWCIGGEAADSIKRIAGMLERSTPIPKAPELHAVAHDALAGQTEGTEFSCLAVCRKGAGGGLGGGGGQEASVCLPEYFVLIRRLKAKPESKRQSDGSRFGHDGAAEGSKYEARSNLELGGSTKVGSVMVGRMRPVSAVESRREIGCGELNPGTARRRNRPISAAAYTRECELSQPSTPPRFHHRHFAAHILAPYPARVLRHKYADQSMRADATKKKIPGGGVTSTAAQFAYRSDAPQLEMDLARGRAHAEAAIADCQAQMLEWKKAALIDLAHSLQHRSTDRMEQVMRLRHSLQEERAATSELAILSQAFT
jgi:hypothetical protein